MKINYLNFLLFVVAVVLFVLLAPFGIICTLFVSVLMLSGMRPLQYLSHTAGVLAIAVDCLGNVVCRDLFNLTLITDDGYGFGEVGETISYVLGRNKQANTLTRTGILLANILNWIDPEHVERAAN